MELKNIQERKY